MSRIVFMYGEEFQEQYPSIDQVDLEVVELSMGKSQTYIRGDRSRFPKHIPCSHPFCDEGGIDPRDILCDMTVKRETDAEIVKNCTGVFYHVRGEENCFHIFHVRLKVTYKQPGDQDEKTAKGHKRLVS